MKLTPLALAGLTALAMATPAVAATTAADAPAAPQGDVRYVVMLKQQPGAASADTANVVQAAAATAEQLGGKVEQKFETLAGYTVSMTADEAAKLASDPKVQSVQQDYTVSIPATESLEAASQAWGLDRIDSQALDGKYTPPNQGSGVHAYVIDTGITSHPEYAERIQAGHDFVDNDEDGTDCQGHGSHVAGTIGGKTVGVAPGATLHSVRVLNCQGSGSLSTVVAGMDWVAKNAQKPAVANMSLGGGASATEDEAVSRMVNAGVTLAVAAGNENSDACGVSPARAKPAITVAASDKSDQRASFSNFGSCVDIVAPGKDIYSTSMGTGYKSLSGTSMATPHVAGAAALYLSAHPQAAPSEVESALVGGSLNGVVQDLKGSPNKLLNVSFIGQGGNRPDGATPNG